MGSSNNPYERLMKLVSSALKMVVEGSRSAESLANLLQSFVFGQVRKALVNYDDPAHRRIDRDQYVFVDPNLRPKHFPVRGKGQREVIYDYLEFDHEPTIKEVLQTVECRSDIRLPDFAETRDYHKDNPRERLEAPIRSLCGLIEYRNGEYFVAYVGAGISGLALYWGSFSDLREQFYRFLVVRK